jgi:hypothetical protein
LIGPAAERDAFRGKTRDAAEEIEMDPKKKTPDEKKHKDELLDEALQETFPASDPIAVNPDEDEDED